MVGFMVDFLWLTSTFTCKWEKIDLSCHGWPIIIIYNFEFISLSSQLIMNKIINQNINLQFNTLLYWVSWEREHSIVPCGHWKHMNVCKKKTKLTNLKF